MRRNSKNHSTGARCKARFLRNEMGVSERFLWNFLRRDQTGFHWRRQVPIGPYVLDFYCAEASLALEVDGELHAARADRDEVRDQYMEEKGIETLRIPSLMLFDVDTAGLDRALRDVILRCEQRSGRSAHDINPRKKRQPKSDW